MLLWGPSGPHGSVARLEASGGACGLVVGAGLGARGSGSGSGLGLRASACSRHASGVRLALDRQQAGGGERLGVAAVSELHCGVASDRGGDDDPNATTVEVVGGGNHDGGSVGEGGSVGLCHGLHDSHGDGVCLVPRG